MNMHYQNTSATEQMVDEKNGPDPIFHELTARLSEGAEIFEYGAGKGRNAIPLAEKGFNVRTQDFNEKYTKDLRDITQDRLHSVLWKLLVEDPSDAVTHVLSQQYDAFLCIRLLHFLGSIENAWTVVHKMQEHTKPGGFNAINFFTAQTIHKPEFFFPTVEEIIEAYAGWEICYQPPTRVNEISATTSGRPMYQQSILFQKKI